MPTPFRPQTTVFLAFLAACFVAALTVSLGRRRAGTPDVPQQALPAVKVTPRAATDAVRLIQRKNQAIAELESEKYEASIALFEELAKEVPAESLVATDRVVAYILHLKSPAMGAQSGSSVYQQTAENADQAAFRLVSRKGSADGSPRRATILPASAPGPLVPIQASPSLPANSTSTFRLRTS